MNVTASLGIAVGIPDKVGAEELLESADRAMYEAKRNGKDRYATANIGRPEPSNADEPRLATAPVRSGSAAGRERPSPEQTGRMIDLRGEQTSARRPVRAETPA
jgi:hypothetical protein